jgi:hypothetical protein
VDGALEEEVAQACGLPLFELRSILKNNLELRNLANENRARHHLARMQPVFEMVEKEGANIWSACKALGIKCNRTFYAVAVTASAKERYPRLEIKAPTLRSTRTPPVLPSTLS